jgi:hypothetical protein
MKFYTLTDVDNPLIKYLSEDLKTIRDQKLKTGGHLGIIKDIKKSYNDTYYQPYIFFCYAHSILASERIHRFKDGALYDNKKDAYEKMNKTIRDILKNDEELFDLFILKCGVKTFKKSDINNKLYEEIENKEPPIITT